MKKPITKTVALLLLLALVSLAGFTGCGQTGTGNPSEPAGESTAPATAPT